MNNYVIHFIKFVLILSSISLSAQDLPNVVPPSPEAASLGKFTEVPVSHYTGVPNISIPLTSYEVGGKTFSVGISYHARGIRVEEIASRVGIGWALNAGGQISRQVRHLVDERTNVGFMDNMLTDALASNTPSKNFFSSSSVRSNYVSAMSNTFDDTIDRLPDVFQLQVGGLSAKFIFNYEDDKPILQSFEDLDIVESYDGTGRISSFIVTDAQGFKYYFGVSKNGARKAQNWEDNVGAYSFPSDDSYDVNTNAKVYREYNTWLLMDIESPNGELASFSYNGETTFYFRRSYDRLESSQSGSILVNHSSKVESYQFQLNEINHNSGRISFESDSDFRLDVNGGFALEAVKIYDNNFDLVKRFQLYQTQREAVNDGNQHPDLKTLEIESSKRMFLDSITEFGKNNFSKPAHVFTYNSQALPNRFSNSQDYWGYYNGGNNGFYLTLSDGINGIVNRQVNKEKSMAGILEKIRYPTGGYTKFYYEHNRGKKGPEFDKIVIPAAINPVEKEIVSIGSLDFQNSTVYNNGVYSKTFTIGQGLLGYLNTNIWFQNETSCSSSQHAVGCRFRVSLAKSGISHQLFIGNNTVTTITPGTYTLTVIPQLSQHDPINNSDDHFSVSINWDESPVLESEYIYTQGKRIKRIEFYDSGNNLESYKAYEYNITNSSITSGVVTGFPSFHSLNPYYDALSGLTVFELKGAISGSPFSTYQGNSIGYSHVTEYYGDETSNVGKTDYIFTLEKDSDADFMSFPYVPPTDNTWLSGLPFNITHYKNSGTNNYKKVKYTRYTYNYGGDAYQLPLAFTPQSLRKPLNSNHSNPGTDLSSEGLLYDKNNSFFRLPLIHVYHPYNGQGQLDLGNHDYKIFHFTGGVLNNYTTEETLYDDNENATLITFSENKYNYSDHYQMSSTLTKTSDNEPIIQKLTYPQELGNASTAQASLVTQHRFVPIEVKSFKDFNNNGVFESSELLNTTETVYSEDSNNSNVLEPSVIKTGKGVQPNMQNRIEFKEYDSDGNILQVSKADGMDITYIYGYNNTLPVAKIENATYTQVSSYVNNIKNKSNLDDDRCLDSSSCDEKNLRIALQSLRSNLPNAMVTTYTYDPLIGVTSITDSKGYTVYYEYDNLHHLVRVKDEDGKIMSENKYHYLLD